MLMNLETVQNHQPLLIKLWEASVHSISHQGLLPVKNETHALWTWHRNQDLYDVHGDIIYIVRQPDRCHVEPLKFCHATVVLRSIHMGGTKLLESLKIKECDHFPSRVSGYCNWESIRLIKSRLTPKQLELFGVICFGHFLNVGDMVLSGQFYHYILLRECHVKNANENTSSLWYHVGNRVIRFSPVEFCLVSGLTFDAYSESTLEIFNRKDSRHRRSYFQDSKVHVKMIIYWFRNLGPNNKYSDDDIVKLALILILKMTLVGKDDRTSILHWALELVDDLVVEIVV
ncbi:hypothetical protein Ddye_030313 [Dipteronia dyeriana]|uniref:DUF1985 domain-containing protein n=1 Tax=Dipteronia dyeriana TaxID=168575 RepID=A0AAD9WLH1_9ROSI|nr:hypothetical protein Ddye_030313 [Dipteronia dyeriana]